LEIWADVTYQRGIEVAATNLLSLSGLPSWLSDKSRRFVD
jgi:hypothetical protein